ncbi:MAG: hypothetical protein RL698_2193, partial [Pseudomonadota bacterium]
MDPRETTTVRRGRGSRIPRRTFVRRGVLLALVLASLAAGWAARPKIPVPGDVVLVVVDTLRADHLPTYGYHRLTA